MAHFVLLTPKVYYDSYDVTGDCKSVSLDIGVNEVDDNCFGSTWEQVLAGLKNASGSFDGSLELTDNGQDETMFSNLGVAERTVSAVGQQEDGNVGYSFKSIQAAYSVLGAHGEAAPFSGSFAGSSQMFRGQEMLSSATARTATGTGTGQNLGAVTSAQRLYAALHVVSASGTTPSMTVTVESDDNSGFTSAVTRLTFTAATARTSEWKYVAGPITDTHYRVRYTISGTSPSFNAFALVGIGT